MARLIIHTDTDNRIRSVLRAPSSHAAVVIVSSLQVFGGRRWGSHGGADPGWKKALPQTYQIIMYISCRDCRDGNDGRGLSNSGEGE